MLETWLGMRQGKPPALTRRHPILLNVKRQRVRGARRG
jgi:hypothetical protein